MSGPVILSIDTTSEFGSLAVRADGGLIAERQVHSPEGFGHILFSELEQLLTQASVTCARSTASQRLRAQARSPAFA